MRSLPDEALMDKPGIPRQAFCCVCGSTGLIEMHHIVRRSHGGHEGPQVPLCRPCHRSHHFGTGRLTFAFNDGWYASTSTRPSFRLVTAWDH